MKFTIATTKSFYDTKDERDKLSKLGFTFKPSDYKDFMIEGEPEIDINTLEELISFTDEHGRIIFGDYNGGIEIYNGYRE